MFRSTYIFLRLAICVLLIPIMASSAVYYIANTGGSDVANGLTPTSAWQTFANLSSLQLAPGDYVLLQRGDTWTDPLVISSAGTLDVPITFGAYGQGTSPVIDGAPATSSTSMVVFSAAANIVFSGIEVRNANRSGIDVYRSSGIVLRGVKVTHSRREGIYTWNSNNISIENSEVAANGLDTSADYDGIRLDGNGTAMSGFRIHNCKIHDNIGGEGWLSSNGIFLGHTGPATPTLHSVVISGNEIYSNGNPDQNQAGRGITGTFQGEVTITGNYIHHNASAGIYLGDYGTAIDIVINGNLFYDNALRQFGGCTVTSANAFQNTILVDNPAITAYGAEVSCSGPWHLKNNVFYYTTPSSDKWRGFIHLNDSDQQQVFSSDWNLFYSAGPQRWMLSDGINIDFQQWQGAGFDPHSTNPH